MTNGLVIGAGPAGLMAAEQMARAGLNVTIAEAKPSPARKFLMAGKSGLNLTKSEDPDAFRAAYSPNTPMNDYVGAFGPAEAEQFARDLGQSIFTGSTGRVFPDAMKASPLLRAWLARLDNMGCTLNRNWRWTGFSDAKTLFQTPNGPQEIVADVVVLAMGGASWARLGSDGLWSTVLQDLGVDITPFQPANMGAIVDWSAHMSKFFGQPVKNISLTAGALSSRGEFVVTPNGVEGGGIYEISSALRTPATVRTDLMPHLKTEQIKAKLARPRGKHTVTNFLRKALKLDPIKIALLREAYNPLPDIGPQLAAAIKSVPIESTGPAPMDGAISTAGGVAWESLTPELMLKSVPGVFCAGEMLDWEAPTGGYLITGCLATGAHAGAQAAAYAKTKLD
jgi:uncharacterized flavoprotein (TIGR03862 family)